MSADRNGGERRLTCKRSTPELRVRSKRSCTAASTTARVGFICLNTHHFVAQTMLSGEEKACLNWPWMKTVGFKFQRYARIRGGRTKSSSALP